MTASIIPNRASLPRAEFQHALRQAMLDNPDLTLQNVATNLNVSRQYVFSLVGKLNKKPQAPRLTEVQTKLPQLTNAVAKGIPVAAAADLLGLSINQVYKAGFRAKGMKKMHNTQARFDAGCRCWRCRRAAGVVQRRASRINWARKVEILDLLAWTDPDSGSHLSQTEVGRLTGVGQAAVSRVAVEFLFS